MGILLNRRIALFAQTLAPFGFFKPIMNFIIRKCSYISVRDSISIENLAREGIDTSKIKLSADPNFLLESSSDERILDIFEQEKINVLDLKNSGFTILGLNIGTNKLVRIGNILEKVEYRKVLNLTAKILNNLMKRYKLYIIFIPHSSGTIWRESGDSLFGLRLRKFITQKDQFSLIKGNYSPQDLVGIIGKCDIILSLRMHPIIAALSMNVPCALISYNDKGLGLMKRFGMEEYTFDIRRLSAEEIVEKMEKLLTAKALNDSIKIKVKEMKYLALCDIKTISSLIARED
jgi:polysaccharide pyruvyl transferase WcaK-like protein